MVQGLANNGTTVLPVTSMVILNARLIEMVAQLFVFCKASLDADHISAVGDRGLVLRLERRPEK